MGCFDATCMVSNLPIRRGVRTALFFLQQQYEDGQGAMADQLYRPFSGPIVGSYNDYGFVEKLDSNSQIVAAEFRAQMDGLRQSNLLDLDEKHVSSVGLTLDTLDSWGQACSRSCVKAKDDLGNLRTIRYCLILKGVFDQLVSGDADNEHHLKICDIARKKGDAKKYLRGETDSLPIPHPSSWRGWAMPISTKVGIKAIPFLPPVDKKAFSELLAAIGRQGEDDNELPLPTFDERPPSQMYRNGDEEKAIALTQAQAATTAATMALNELRQQWRLCSHFTQVQHWSLRRKVTEKVLQIASRRK